MIFVILVGILIVAIHQLNRHWLSFWTRHGFEQLTPKIVVGNAGPLLTQQASMGEYLQQLYNKFIAHKCVGLYMFYRPVLLVTDAKLAQEILIKDFASFHDRPMSVDEKHDPLSTHLFNVAGQRWRDLRVKLSPTFSSGKLKGMFPIIKKCGLVLEEYIVKHVEKNVDVFEFRDLMARFNTNIISSVAFGIENDCINEPNHIFRRMGAKFFEPNLKNGIRAFFNFFGKELFHKLKLKTVDDDVEEFIFSIMKQTIEHREKTHLVRNDFMQALIQLKNQGYVSVDKSERNSDDEGVDDGAKVGAGVKKLEMAELAANVFVFFIAGFETSSSTMSFCLYELAKNKKIQQKVQREIDQVLDATGLQSLTYDTLNDMKYLECCIDETLRKYPIAPVLFRECTKDYKVRGSDLIIPKGTSIFFPLMGFQRDPKIYENPLLFKPERFLSSSNGEGKASGCFYLPFGDGPRNCIGTRLGKLTAKLGLATVLSKFTIELDDTDMIDKELTFNSKTFVLTPVKDFNLKVTPRS